MLIKNQKSKRILLELLHHPEGNLSKYRLSKETGTNISWVIHFLRRLDKQKLIKGTKVINFNGLVDYYLTLDQRPKHFEFQLPQPLELLAKTKKTYALTTYSAENLISHHLFPSRIDVYIKENELGKWKRELFQEGLIGKGNLRLIVASDDYQFKFVQEIDKLKVVTIPLLMIDLKREGGVCLEAYEYLVRKYVQK